MSNVYFVSISSVPASEDMTDAKLVSAHPHSKSQMFTVGTESSKADTDLQDIPLHLDKPETSDGKNKFLSTDTC